MSETPTPPTPDNEDLTPEELSSLQSQLKKYQQAYKEEYETEQADNPDNVIENTLKYFKNNATLAAGQIVWLMQNSTSDATRLAASKYVIECLKRGAVEDQNDPVKQILQSLMNNPGPKIQTPEPTEINEPTEP